MRREVRRRKRSGGVQNNKKKKKNERREKKIAFTLLKRVLIGIVKLLLSFYLPAILSFFREQ